MLSLKCAQLQDEIKADARRNVELDSDAANRLKPFFVDLHIVGAGLQAPDRIHAAVARPSNPACSGALIDDAHQCSRDYRMTRVGGQPGDLGLLGARARPDAAASNTSSHRLEVATRIICTLLDAGYAPRITMRDHLERTTAGPGEQVRAGGRRLCAAVPQPGNSPAGPPVPGRKAGGN